MCVIAVSAPLARAFTYYDCLADSSTGSRPCKQPTEGNPDCSGKACDWINEFDDCQTVKFVSVCLSCDTDITTVVIGTCQKGGDGSCYCWPVM